MPAAFNADDPRYQRELQRRRSKRSMSPGRLARADEGEATAQHAGYQLGRQQQFVGMEQSRLASQLAHKHRMESLGHQGRMIGLAESQLASERAQLMPSMLLGLGGIAASGYLGYKRRKAGEAEAYRQKLRGIQIDNWISGQIPGGYGFHVTGEEQ